MWCNMQNALNSTTFWRWDEHLEMLTSLAVVISQLEAVIQSCFDTFIKSLLPPTSGLFFGSVVLH